MLYIAPLSALLVSIPICSIDTCAYGADFLCKATLLVSGQFRFTLSFFTGLKPGVNEKQTCRLRTLPTNYKSPPPSVSMRPHFFICEQGIY